METSVRQFLLSMKLVQVLEPAFASRTESPQSSLEEYCRKARVVLASSPLISYEESFNQGHGFTHALANWEVCGIYPKENGLSMIVEERDSAYSDGVIDHVYVKLNEMVQDKLHDLNPDLEKLRPLAMEYKIVGSNETEFYFEW